MKVWITKYALTRGIFAVVAEDCGNDMVKFKGGNPGNVYAHGEGREWHRTREAAETRALAMRDAKVLSLQKQIKKLQAMTFEVADAD